MLATIDSGICPSSTELANRVMPQLEIRFNEYGSLYLHRSTAEFRPKFSHGTQVASIAAGTTIGVAPEASILPFVLPISQNRKFEQLTLLYAVSKILEDDGTIMNGVPLNKKIDVLLIPGGVVLSKRLAPEFQKKVRDNILSLHEEHDVSIVAAIGNSRGKIAFPANFQFVTAVGHLTADGKRHPDSGFGLDTTGNILPNISIIGESLEAEGLHGKRELKTGSSFASAIVAGVFCLLASKHKTAQSRSSRIRMLTRLDNDENGEIKILDIL